MSDFDYVTFDPRIPKNKVFLTKILILAIVLMYIVEIFFNAIYSDKAIILLGAKWNEGITNGEYWRFITPTFLHGNLIHLILNLVALNVFGNELESIYGWFRFFILFILTSWGSILASYSYSQGVSIGASGVVFGIIGGLIVFFFRQREKLAGANLRFKSMYTLVGINLLLGMLLPRIDNSAHIGGLVTGLIIGLFISPEYKTEKEESINKVVIIKKKDLSRVYSGLFLVITMLFWLTKLAIKSHTL